MAEHDDLPYIVIERRSAGVTPFLWGAVVGAAVALMLAPRTGEEIQRELRERAQRMRMTAGDRVNEARDAVERTRSGVQGRVDSVRDAFRTGSRQARDAMDAGRRVARDTRSELERRVAEAKSAARSEADTSSDTPADRVASPPSPDVVATDIVLEKDAPRHDLG